MSPFFQSNLSQNYRPSVYDSPSGSQVSSEARSSSPQSSSGQDQFFDGQPTASLNRQPPGFVRTFSQSGLQRGQFEAGTAPNAAYIARTSSQPSQGIRHGHQPMSAAQETSGEGRDVTVGQGPSMTQETPNLDPDIKEARDMAHKAFDQVFVGAPVPVREPPHRGGVGRASTSAGIIWNAQRQHTARLLASISVPARPVRPIDEPHEDQLHHSNKKKDPSLSPHDNTQLQSHTQKLKDEGDYFGDTIAGEEALFPPAPPQNSFRSRSPTPEYRIPGAMRLYPTNPDPPSRNATDENLPIRLSSSSTFQRHPSYLTREPIQPAHTAYPSPLRHPNLGRTAASRAHRAQAEKPYHEWDSRRKHRLPDLPWNITPKRSADGEATQEDGTYSEDSTNDVAPVPLAFYAIHAIIWSSLVGYFFWRVSQVKDTVAFDCSELEAQLLHLAGNSTLFSSSETPGRTTLNATAVQTEVSDASAIGIPEQFRGMLKGHCVLRPVHPTIVLASSFEIWFVAMMAACGITYWLETLMLLQFRSLFERSGPTSWVTLGFRIGVRVGAVGIVCLLIAGPAWAMKGGVSA